MRTTYIRDIPKKISCRLSFRRLSNGREKIQNKFISAKLIRPEDQRFKASFSGRFKIKTWLL